MDLLEQFDRVVAALDAAGVAYALCGGLAVNVYGHVRATMDIDVLLPPEQVDRALAALRPLGYDLDAGVLPFDAGSPNERAIRRVTRLEDGDFLCVDMVLVTPVFRDVWASRTAVPWRGRRLPVVSRAGLIAMKQVAGRTQDQADIERLQEVADHDP